MSRFRHVKQHLDVTHHARRSRISSKAAFTRQRTGQAQSEHYAHGHGHGQTFPRTESAHAHTGPAWLQRGRHAGAQRAAGSIQTTCHTPATITCGKTSHTCDRTHADVHHSHVLQPAVTALIGLTNRVASEAFLPTNHHALPTQPARSPKGPKPRERGQAHAP